MTNQDPAYLNQLDPDEQKALQNLGAEEQAKADLADVAVGPGIPQKPDDRIMTGAIDAAEAAEQAAAVQGADLTKPVNEKGKNV